MKLSLFREQEAVTESEDPREITRRLLVSFLNKGIVPTWDIFFQELPTQLSGESLEKTKSHFQDLVEWSFLQRILDFEATEFFFHSIKDSQRLVLDGTKTSIEIPLHHDDWQLWLEIISIQFKQTWNVQNPFVSFYADLFGKKYRLSLIHGSSSPIGQSKLVMRCLSSIPFKLTRFGETQLLTDLMKDKRNIVIAGSTGSGKTSLLSSLLGLISPQDHLVILEDTYEILCPHAYQTRLLAGESSQTSLKSYLSYVLRLSPDRIVLGEMRSHEVIPFLMAMNTGHKGLMGTIHSSSAHDALHRIALLFSLYSSEANLSFEKVMELLCRNLEYVVFMENKKVKDVIKILGSDKGIPFYENVLGENFNF